MILHTVNKTSACLQSCLTLATSGDSILLIEDGVYAALDTPGNSTMWHEAASDLNLYALESDLAARGLSEKMLPVFTCADWSQFVALTTEHDKVISWG